MYCLTKSEEELFSDIKRFSKLFITMQHALVALSDIRNSLIADLDNGSVSFSKLCRGFGNLISALKGIRDEIGTCDPDHLPELVFLEFSSALHYVLRRVRKVLPVVYTDNPIQGVFDGLDELKDLCRPEKRDQNLTVEEFQLGVTKAVDGMIRHGYRIATLIRSTAAESGVSRDPTPADAALCRIEQTVDDTNETAHRLDGRDRRHRQESGKGGVVALSVQRKCAALWNDCQANPKWFGDAAHGKRVTKRMAYDYLRRQNLLSPVVDSLKTFLRAIDSARKLTSGGKNSSQSPCQDKNS